MAETNLIKTEDIDITVKAIEMVSSFGQNWDHFRQITGIMQPIRKAPGTALISKTVTGTLQSGDVAEGETIPYSKYTVAEKEYAKIKFKKYRKGITLEDIDEYGADTAYDLTNDQFVYDIQSEVTGDFYDYAKTGTLAVTADTLQAALAKAKGAVVNKFKTMHRSVSNVVGFVNTVDMYDYLATANITVQSAFGWDYVENFLGYRTIFLVSDDELEQGKCLAIPAENIKLYYADPSDSEYARAGFNFYTDGVTNLIGLATKVDYTNLTSDQVAIYGLSLFAEYIDGIAVASFEDAASPILVKTVEASE